MVTNESLTEKEMIDATLAWKIDEAAAAKNRSVDEEIATGRWASYEWFGRRDQSNPQVRKNYENGKKVLARYRIVTDYVVYVDGDLRRWENGRSVRFDVDRPEGRQIAAGYNRCTMRYELVSFIPQPRLQGETHASV